MLESAFTCCPGAGALGPGLFPSFAIASGSNRLLKLYNKHWNEFISRFYKNTEYNSKWGSLLLTSPMSYPLFDPTCISLFLKLWF